MAKARTKDDQPNAPVTERLRGKKGFADSAFSHLVYIRLIVFVIAVGCGILHWMHVSKMHENHITFSHLSSTERELTFRTEMGFYYSYFKQLILASTLSEGWSSLLADIRSEVPLCLNHSILGDQAAQNQSQKQCRPLNAMQRFNLYPELILATLYRILFSFHLLPIQCYRVTRQLDGNPIAIVVSPSSFAKAIRNDRYHPYQQLSSPKKCQKFYPHTLSLDLQSLMFCVWVFIHKIVVSNINSSGRFLYGTSMFMVPNETLAATEPSVTSCVGLAEPAYFYTEIVFALSGLILVSLCISGWLIADRCSGYQTLMPRNSCAPAASIGDHWLAIWGAVLPALGYFYNHREATRVQWTPPLRESFAYPFFVLQQTFLLYLLTGPEFFALSTQIASLLIACCLTVASNQFHRSDHRLLVRGVRSVVSIHLIALVLSYLLQFGNALLLTSVYFPGLIGAWLGLTVLLRYLTPSETKSSSNQSTSSVYDVDDLGHGLTRLFYSCLLPALITASSAFVLFYLINWSLGSGQGEQHDGGHILDILREKLQPDGHYHTFHTRMYTCSPEFDFIGRTALEQPIHTGLLPVAMGISVLVCLHALIRLVRSLGQSDQLDTRTTRRSQSAIISSNLQLSHIILMPFISLFVVIQLFFFTIMAVLIMRLKLFWTPHLCLTLALLAQPTRWHQLVQWLVELRTRVCTSQVHRVPNERPKRRSMWIAHLFFFPLVSFMSLHGIENLKAEWNIQGQFSDLNKEVLIDWFRSLPPPVTGSSTPWVIAGQISVQGSLRLMLPAVPQYPSPQPLEPGESESSRPGFAFTNHPHYENAELRHRTVLAYTIYSRRSIEEAWQIYRHQLQVCSPLAEWII
ncbi:hypothetical protein FBUS_09148 [Fasciolopsis buskii]|uniref:Uncharacterized protein n=1 Tax=Fasciolopsis buskii TaxID=27845 RepID=A0A8E0VPE2_9TREM|nr:hypothetical protein FBUS_09148 [Fasciolopsis buski]